MLDHQYKAKQAKLEKRNWSLTIISAVLCLFVSIGIIAVWRYAEHDTSVILALLPLLGMAFLLFFAALNGRKKTFKYVYDSILDLIFYWR